MRWLLVVVVMMLGAQVAHATKPTPPKVQMTTSLSAPIGAKPPTLKVVVTNTEVHPVEFAKVENPVCWIGLYLVGGLNKNDGTEVATVKPCKDAGTETVQLAPKDSITVEVALDKLFRKLPKGTYRLSLQFHSGEATRRDTKLTVWSESTISSLRFTVAKLVKTFTVTVDAPATLTKGVTLTFVSHGHKHMPVGGGQSPLLISAKVTQGGTAENVYASVDGTEPFALGKHVFDLLDANYGVSMELRYWGTIDISP